MSRENILQEHNRNKNNLRPQKTKSGCKQNAKENPTEREEIIIEGNLDHQE